MQCRLCFSNKKLVKAHIIPEAFFRVLRDGDESPLIVSGAAKSYTQRSPIGVYDNYILCEECEKRFGSLDDYGIKIFLTQREQLFQPVFDNNKTVAFQGKNIDQKLLVQFLVATLWRASVSTHTFYKRVNLGPHEEAARNMILEPHHIIPSVFAAVLSCWNASEELKSMTSGLMDPFVDKWHNGANAYRVYFGQIVAYIKVDQRPTPDPFNKCALLAQDEVTLITRDFGKSKDFAAMKHTALLSYKNHLSRSAR